MLMLGDWVCLVWKEYGTFQLYSGGDAQTDTQVRNSPPPRAAIGVGVLMATIQGYLAHKKQRSPRTLQQDYA